MNVALLGDDPALIEWAKRARSCGTRVVAAAVPDALARLLNESCPDIRIEPDWELPLAGVEFNAVIAGGNSPAIVAQAAAVGARIPILVLPAARQALELAYRLDVELDDRRCAWPAFLHRFSPAVAEFLDRFERGDLGDLRLLRFERTLTPAFPAGTHLLRGQIDDAFLQDVDLLRLLGGRYSGITATLIGAEDDRALQATVTLSGESVPEAVWLAAPGVAPGWKLTLTGTKSTAVLECREGGGIALSIGGKTIPAPDADPATNGLMQFLSFSAQLDPPRRPLMAPSWDDYVRATDLLDGLHRSLRRRRTIDLHFGTVSERSQFKTQMTAVGCAVLLWTMFGAIAGLAAAKLLDPREPIERRAAAAGALVWEEDFNEGGATLALESRQRLLDRIAIDGEEAIVIVESSAGSDARIDEARRRQVANIIAEKFPDASPLIDVRPLAGRMFHRLMLIGWLIIFGPLAIFLALQALILITRSRE
jgi:hypothetical protein